MRYRVLLAIAAAAVLWAAPAGAAEAPRSIAGLTLGQPIEDAADRVLMQTALPVRYMENLREVEIQPTEGFKSGLIAYTTCLRPETIVRIKLKYADGSRAFYRRPPQAVQGAPRQPRRVPGGPVRRLRGLEVVLCRPRRRPRQPHPAAQPGGRGREARQRRQTHPGQPTGAGRRVRAAAAGPAPRSRARPGGPGRRAPELGSPHPETMTPDRDPTRR